MVLRAHRGPRMEDAFRFALLSLFEANSALCAADPRHGRAAQHTLLEVPTILSDTGFRREVLGMVTDPGVRAWWSDYFEPLERRFQQELVNPVLSKIHRFEGSRAARHIVAQPASTVDPSAWLCDGAIVIVNTARGTVGDNAAALIGGTLLNLVTLAVAEQARLDPAARAPISIFVDEFHTIPGADYEVILAELNKYGDPLATSSLNYLHSLQPRYHFVVVNCQDIHTWGGTDYDWNNPSHVDRTNMRRMLKYIVNHSDGALK